MNGRDEGRRQGDGMLAGRLAVAMALVAGLAILPAPGHAADDQPSDPAATAPAVAAAKYPRLEAFEATVPTWFPKLLGAQLTVVNQDQLPFHSSFSGLNSLNQDGEDKTSQTRSLNFGAQAGENLQLYLDMEWFLGNGIHGGNGLAGYANGEVVRAGTSTLAKTPYAARAFGQYILPLSGERTAVERAMDQLPGQMPTDYVVAKFGKMAASDDFDVNRYANFARTQFLNFSLINNTAWDFAADTRGYTYGAVLGLVRPGWALKLGSYLMPQTANGQRLSTEVNASRGDNIEFTLRDLPHDAVVRILAYENHAQMGRYSAAISQGQQNGTTPSITADEQPRRIKYGFGLNAELPLADDGDTGLFFRAGWNDGKTETFAFTEVDRLLSLGGQVSGAHWGRDEDWVGIGLAANFLSGPHKDYLAAGGTGFMVGDGKLTDYEPEEIVETYYSFKFTDYLRLSPDYQFIRNPGYNGDRGPVHILGFRVRASM